MEANISTQLKIDSYNKRIRLMRDLIEVAGKVYDAEPEHDDFTNALELIIIACDSKIIELKNEV